MRLRRDSNGIPVVDALDLERLAERFLQHVAPDCLNRPTFAPLAGIMTLLKEEGHLTFSFDKELGVTAEGRKYLGYFDPANAHIAIDCSIVSGDPRFPFTVAHELGHFYLHSGVAPRVLESATRQIRDTARDLVVHRIDSDRPRSLMEWQANRFAAGILMPRGTVRDALIDAQRDAGISRNIGYVYYDPTQRNSRRDLGLISEKLGATYQVSRAVVRVRLYELGLVQEHIRGGQPQRAGDLMGSALSALFGE